MLDLSLDVRQAQANCPSPQSPSSPGVAYLAKLSFDADLEVGSQLGSTDPGPDTLPLPANMEGRMLYFRVLTGGPVTVDANLANQGSTPIPVGKGGVLVLVPSDGEYITSVTVTGSATYEWSVTGTEA